MSFVELGLCIEICEVLQNHLRWERPTDIQAEAIPSLLTGRDICVGAPTGSGKTGAYGPALLQLCSEALSNERPCTDRTTHELAGSSNTADRGASDGADLPSGSASKRRATSCAGPRAIVLAPSSELVKQISQFLRAVSSKSVNVDVGSLANTSDSLAECRSGILVGTPGKFVSFLAGKSLNLGEVRHVVIDEADMLAATATKDIRTIYNLCNSPQTCLFSATIISEPMQRLSEEVQSSADWICGGGQPIPSNIRVYAIILDEEMRSRCMESKLFDGSLRKAAQSGLSDPRSMEICVTKLVVLLELIDAWQVPQAIIFVRTRMDAARLEQFL
mmetsp:Transcript_4106/g.12344  ORF Transcript_4106/g.12344 Transcript_4106/m.12344 type:complete len:332 (+) Transcript_4106:280-1275(+)